MTKRAPFPRLVYGEFPYTCIVLTAWLWGVLYIAAMATLSSFAILKTLYIVFFERVNEISDLSIVRAIRGFTIGIAVTTVATEATVKVGLSVSR